MSAAAGNERVRFCMQCGEVVAFDVRTCGACGHYEPHPDEPGVEPERPCPHCAHGNPVSLLFCPQCGREVDGGGGLPAGVPWDEAAERDAGAPAYLMIALALAAPLALAAAIAAGWLT